MILQQNAVKEIDWKVKIWIEKQFLISRMVNGFLYNFVVLFNYVYNFLYFVFPNWKRLRT